MSYDWPEYKPLQDATDNLQQLFSDLSDRYTTPSYAELREKVLSLAKLYKDEVEKTKGKTPEAHRLDQIACITQLAAELPAPSKDQTTDWGSRFILLGALFYRLKRIDNSYGSLYGFFGKSKNSSALNNCIEAICVINDENRLDDLTLFHSCTAYREYLKSEGVSNTYAYIKKDPLDFFSNLDSIIKKAKRSINADVDIDISRQYNQIFFIQSVAKKLAENDMSLSVVLTNLTISMKARLKSKQELDYDDILKCIEDIKTPPLEKWLILHFLSYEKVVSEINIEQFKNEIESSNNILSSSALVGAYVLSLPKGEPKISCLTQTLNFALNIGKRLDKDRRNILDDLSRAQALEAFNIFIKLPGSDAINMTVWGKKTILEKKLRKELVALNQDYNEGEKEEKSSSEKEIPSQTLFKAHQDSYMAL